MAIVKNVNSYETLEAAEEYFSMRLDAAAWTDAPESQKIQSLVTAVEVLNRLEWNGVAVSESQTLAFPRVGSFYEPMLGMTVTLDSNVPVRIVKAQFELAYHLLNNDGLLDDTGGAGSLALAGLQLADLKSPNLLPQIVSVLIRPLLKKKSPTWWRAN